jgi:hypothetical protein
MRARHGRRVKRVLRHPVRPHATLGRYLPQGERGTHVYFPWMIESLRASQHPDVMLGI